MLKYKTIVTGTIMENCFLLYDTDTQEAIFIDPGDDADDLIDTAKKLGVQPKAIYNTHAHFDHTMAAKALMTYFDIPFFLHEAEKPVLDALPSQPSLFGMSLSINVPEVHQYLTEQSSIALGSHTGRVIHTPGHTPGGACFLFGNLLFAGDTLFAGSVGRSDLPGGNGGALIQSIRRKLFTLPADTKVLCGHGPATTIGHEQRYNPFAG